jgi:hypothetical protein
VFLFLGGVPLHSSTSICWSNLQYILSGAIARAVLGAAISSAARRHLRMVRSLWPGRKPLSLLERLFMFTCVQWTLGLTYRLIWDFAVGLTTVVMASRGPHKLAAIKHTSAARNIGTAECNMVGGWVCLHEHCRGSGRWLAGAWDMAEQQLLWLG